MSDAPAISCEEALARLAEYLDGELHHGEHSGVEHHLTICRSCYSRADFERRLRDRVASLGSEPPSENFGERIRLLVDRFTL